MSNPAKGVIAVLALVVAGALFFVIRDDGDSEPAAADPAPTAADVGNDQPQNKPKPEKPQKPEEPKPEPEVARIVIEGGQPVGGVQELSFDEGDSIRFVVESDVADHVHLHGYDVMQDVAAGGSTEFNVPATLTGVFEAELEDSVVPIAEITVEPG
jgi:hypothetical protein